MGRWMELAGLVGAALVAAVSLPACAAEEGEDDALVDESAADLTARQLPNVAAVEVAELRLDGQASTKTIGAPKKVKKLVSAPKKLRANAAIPRCVASTRTQLTYLDAGGSKLATLTTSCPDYGFIRFESGADYLVKLDSAVVTEVTSAPFAVGDALWGITKIAMYDPTFATSERTFAGDELKPILAGFDLNAVPSTTIPMPRCVPKFIATFQRGDEYVATMSFICNGSELPASPPSSLAVRFYAPDSGSADTVSLPRGATLIDPRALFSAYASAN